jgi:hypothetical protein
MKREEIEKKFMDLFPRYFTQVNYVKKVGSKTIALMFDDGSVLFFLYVDDKNWNLGTKQWRKRPDPIPKKAEV